MFIALLAVLGVDLIVIVVLLAAVLSRRRWVSRQPGAFKGAIRVVQGDVHGLGSKWRRGYGRWIGQVLVWTKAPFLFRNELVVAEAPAGEARTAEPGEVKRLGKHPAVVPVAVDRGARIEVAVSGDGDGGERARGPFAAAPGTGRHKRDSQARSPGAVPPGER
jgi:hypothetical protein